VRPLAVLAQSANTLSIWLSSTAIISGDVAGSQKSAAGADASDAQCLRPPPFGQRVFVLVLDHGRMSFMVFSDGFQIVDCRMFAQSEIRMAMAYGSGVVVWRSRPGTG